MRNLVLGAFLSTAAFANTTEAATLTQVQTERCCNPLPTILIFDEFDPALGRLEQVDFEFRSVFTLNFQTQLNTQTTGIGQVDFVPYDTTAILSLGFEPIGDGRGFETIVDSVAPFQITADGQGGVATAILPVIFTVSVQNNSIPQVGLDDFDVIVRANNTANAQALSFFNSVSDFVPINSLATGIPILTRFEASATTLDPRISLLSIEGQGTFTKAYHYEPFVDDPGGGGPDPEPNVVPLPAGLPLLLTSFVLLVLGRFSSRHE